MSERERRTLWSWLVGPNARIGGEPERTTAHLLGVLMLIHWPAALIGIGLSEMLWRQVMGRSLLSWPAGGVLVATVLLLMVSWVILRAGRLRAAALLYLATNAAFPMVAPFVGQPRPEMWMLASGVVPIVLSAIALPYRWVAVAMAVTVGGCAIELLFLPLDRRDITTGFGLLVVLLGASVLMLALRRHYGALADRRLRLLHESETAVRASEERLRALVEGARDIILVVDRTGFRTATYGALEAITGYHLEERDPGAPFASVHPDDTSAVRAAFDRLLREPGGVTRLEWRHLHRDGTYRWVEALAVNRLDVPGIDGIVVNVRDVSERRRGEEVLRRGEERYRTLFRTVTDAVSLMDPESGRLLEVNDAACRQLGYARAELLSLRIHDITPSEIGEQLAEAVRTVAEKGHVVFESTMRRKDGSLYPVEVAASLTEVDGKPAIVGVARDITERRRAEQERQLLQDQLLQAVKMESVGRLAGGVAHDFNNLLTAVLGNAELAADRARAGEDVSEFLAEIQEAAMSAAALTRQLLAFSRKQVIEPRLLDVNEVIARMHKMLVRLIGEDIELRTLPGKELGVVCADPGLLEQVILNLAVNARDAMPGGGILLIETANVSLDPEYARAHTQVTPGPHVRLAISDTGSGMSDEVKRHLFEPFFTTKPRGQGTGLGLATIYGAIRQSNGSIEVYSELGKGTTFKIFLPVVSGEAEGRTTLPPDAPVLAEAERRVILLVEDDQRVRDFAARALRACGYEVLPAASAEQALDLASEHRAPIHLLLTDVVMPAMNGRQLAEQLRPLHPESRVLYTSGYTEDIIAHHGVLDPGIELVSKPYSADVLSRRVREVLAGT